MDESAGSRSTHREKSIAVFIAGIILVAAFWVDLAYRSSDNGVTKTTTYKQSVAAGISPPIYSPAIVLNETSPASVLGIPLTTEAAADNASTTGPQTNVEGIAITTYDTGHLNLTVYRGDYPNGSSIIAVTVSNIGQQSVEVGSLTIGASNSSDVTILEGFAIGCTHDSTYTETVTSINQDANTTQTTVQTEHFVCNEVASQNPTTLSPGQSLSAYVKVPTSSIDGFGGYGASADYSMAGVAHEYLLSAAYNAPSTTT
jgi:hypothetical protein